MVKNEIILVEKIEKRLQQRREEVVFPLSPTHRKELRQLKEKNIGNLRQRLRNIKEIKKKEFIEKYESDIIKKIEKTGECCDMLNKDWEKRIKDINKILFEREILEKKNHVENLRIETDYGKISDLKDINCKRKVSFDKFQRSKEIASEKFIEKFGEHFTAIDKKIDEVTTQYEEAINFGDLEIVKELYYIMKTAENFFEKVTDLKV